MFNFSEKAAIKINDLLIFDRQEMIKTIKENQALFKDLVLDYSPSKHTAYGYNQFKDLIKISYEGDLIQKIVLCKNTQEFRRKKVIISYDGSRYFGFQYQTKRRTIQGELSKIIKEINHSQSLVQGASRTDTGVHAYQQVLHFDTGLDISNESWKNLLNHQLPEDILVKKVEDVHPLFHSRYDVYKKRYVYKIRLEERDPFLTNYYHFEKSLNVDLMKSSIKDLIGRHDFTSFAKSKVDDPYRTVNHADIIQKDNDIYIIIEANGFLRYMVRIIVDYLLKIGKGQSSLSIKDVLKNKNRKHTNSMAKANGLYLEEIMY